MSINSIDYLEISEVSSKWEHKDESATNLPDCKKQQAAARRRIELFRDIQASGLTIAEAKELGLLH